MTRETKDGLEARERSAARAKRAIPDFPEIILHRPGCRLCDLAISNPEAVRKIHDFRKEGLSLRALSDRTGEILEAPIPHGTIDRHFKNHVNLSVLVAEAPESESRRKGALGEDHNDYFEIWDLYVRLQPLLSRAYTEILNAPKLSSYDVVMLLKIFSEARQILESLGKQRRDDALIKQIADAQMKYAVQHVADPLGERLRLIRDQLRRGDDAKKVAEEIEAFLKGDLVPLFQAAAARAREQSHNQFKLH